MELKTMKMGEKIMATPLESLRFLIMSHYSTNLPIPDNKYIQMLNLLDLIEEQVKLTQEDCSLTISEDCWDDVVKKMEEDDEDD